ncbi:DNA-binding MarR family transcriptional regulator [Actinocorallia herbida]|uniref:DNA-binding MarR family transcriptional regulator n=1 Tax=Actinocorallia herbida TaxID=58109 RepID=A0A3N1D5Q3_9ACTN|nr:MarR family winged helix-turn-helix transcriptional regulator [Actinocorallia herbida]ROO88867.1 DNA-binding MarR family transcriptional regulator [Actinocorallia herbida]
MEDVVARVMRQWREVRPELDPEPMGVIGRLNRCALLLQQAEETPLARFGLTRPEFDILTALRRVDHEITPGRLARETFASGAAVTKRVRALEERGLVARRPDARDRRVAHLSLTDEGGALIDEVLPAQLAHEASVLSALDDGTRADLADNLSRLLIVLEGRLGGL